MAVFFFVVGLEVRRDLAVGELTDRRRVVLPLLAGVGGMVVPGAASPRRPRRGRPARGLGRRHRHRHRVPPRRARPGRPARLDPAAGLPADPLGGRRHRRGQHHRRRLLRRHRPPRPARGARRRACSARSAGRGCGGRGPTSWGVVAVGGDRGVGAARLDRGDGRGPAGPRVRAAARTRSRAPRALVRAFRQSPMAEVGRSRATRPDAGGARRTSGSSWCCTPGASYVIVPVFALANAGVDLRGGAARAGAGVAAHLGRLVGLVVGKFVGIGRRAALAVPARAGPPAPGRRAGPGRRAAAALSGIGFTVSLLIVGLAFETRSCATRRRSACSWPRAGRDGLGWVAFRLAAARRGETRPGCPRAGRPVDPDRDHLRGPVGAPLTLVEYGGLRVPVLRPGHRGRPGGARALRGRPALRLPAPAAAGRPPARRAAPPRPPRRPAPRAGSGRCTTGSSATRTSSSRRTSLGDAGRRSAWTSRRSCATSTSSGTPPRVREDVADAEASGARGTPTFFIGERRHTGPHDAQTLIAALEAARVRASG